MRGPGGEDLPDAVLFACSLNAVRSPIAAALMRHLYGKYVYVDSVGVKKGALDPFAEAVLQEIGIETVPHNPKTFDELEDTNFDLVISLSPEAQHKAVDLTRHMAVQVEYWPTPDPTAVEGSREQRLDAYRAVRDGLLRRLTQRFGVGPTPAP
jgi:protein-tyrosine-phosphatase